MPADPGAGGAIPSPVPVIPTKRVAERSESSNKTIAGGNQTIISARGGIRFPPQAQFLPPGGVAERSEFKINIIVGGNVSSANGGMKNGSSEPFFMTDEECGR